MANVGPQNIKDFYALLDSTNLNIIKETVSLIRDGINSTPDPWLLFGIDYYITTGNEKVIDLLSTLRTPNHKYLLFKVDEYLQKPATRVRALNILGNVFTKEPSWIHEVADFKAFTTMIKIINTDSDIVSLTISLYNIVILLPKVPTKVGNHLNSMFKAYVRLVAWNAKRHTDDVGELNLSQLKTAVYAYFLCLYGMYPNCFTAFLQEYCSLKHQTPQQAVQTINEMSPLKIYQKYILPMLNQVRLHPKLVYYTKETEVSKEKWRKMEPHDVLADIADVCLDPTEKLSQHNNDTEQEEDQSPPETVNDNKKFSEMLMQRVSSNIREIKPKLIDVAITENIEKSTSIWSPSIIMGLSTPPPSRSISPSPALLENTSSPHIEHKYSSRSRHTSGEKIRPSSLNLTAAKAKDGSRQSTPCDKTPTLALPRFDFSTVKSASAGNTPVKVVPSDKRISSHLPKQMSEESPDKEDIEVSNISNSSRNFDKGDKMADESFVNISYQNISSEEHKVSQDIVNALQQSVQSKTDASVSNNPGAMDALNVVSQQKSMAAWSPNEILDFHMKLVAQTLPNLLVDEQNIGNWPKFTNPEDEIKSLKTALLQMHCTTLFERHKRQQHTLRGRRLKKKVYECVALEEKNKALRHQLQTKDEEIEQLKLLVKEHANTIKNRSEEYKKDCSKYQTRIKDWSRESNLFKQENARLKVEKGTDRTELERLNELIKEQERELHQRQLQLETHKHNKTMINKLTDQVMLQQKELLIVGELNNKVTDLTNFSHKYKVVQQAEYDMMENTLQKSLETAEKEAVQMKMKLARSEDKSKFYESEAEKFKRLLEDQKKYLENVKSLARLQMKSVEDKYNNQKSITARMETHSMELYAKIQAMDKSGNFHLYSANRVKPIKSNSKALTAVSALSSQVFGISPQLSPPIRSGIIAESSSKPWTEKPSLSIDEDDKAK